MTILSSDTWAALQQQYVSGFPERIQALQTALQSRKWDVLKHHLHQLAGTGASYKMPEITTLARIAESHIKAEKPEMNVVASAVDRVIEALQDRLK